MATKVKYNAMKKFVFGLLAKINKALFPSMAGKDLSRLSKADKIIVGWRYYITKNALDN